MKRIRQRHERFGYNRPVTADDLLAEFGSAKARQEECKPTRNTSTSVSLHCSKKRSGLWDDADRQAYENLFSRPVIDCKPTPGEYGKEYAARRYRVMSDRARRMEAVRAAKK